MILFAGNSYSQQAFTVIDAHDRNIRYEGRIGMNRADRAEIYWPGSSVEIVFRGTAISAVLQEQRRNYYTVIIDRDSTFTLRTDTAKQTYALASNLPEGKHTVEIFRRTGWNGITSFFGFQCNAGSKIMPAAPKKRAIEFYGNSITVGSGMYPDGTRGGSENNFLSYGALTARHFDAGYTCIARSGIGLMVSWFYMIMPDIYNRLNPFDSTSLWDFSKTSPGIVVINLFQNDYSIFSMPDSFEFKRRFGNTMPGEDYITGSYKKFVQRIRSHYPAANIICVLGNMDAVSPGSKWPGYIQNAVSSLGDKKVFTHFFPYKNTPDHPSEAEHKQMAESLEKFIERNIKW